MIYLVEMTLRKMLFVVAFRLRNWSKEFPRALKMNRTSRYRVLRLRDGRLFVFRYRTYKLKLKLLPLGRVMLRRKRGHGVLVVLPLESLVRIALRSSSFPWW